MYRTVAGYPATCYSRDRGRTWTKPDYLRYPDGRPVKNPRAANFAWACGEGRYLYWFHNNGGPAVLARHGEDSSYPYNSPRNPIWFSGGVEIDSPTGKVLQWSEPEIGLYDDDPFLRMSYPDLIIDGTKLFVTETNKQPARLHELQEDQLSGLWKQVRSEIAFRSRAPFPRCLVF